MSSVFLGFLRTLVKQCHQHREDKVHHPNNYGNPGIEKHVNKGFMQRSIHPMVHNTKESGKMIRNMVRISTKKFLFNLLISHRIGKGIYIWKSTGNFYEGDFANDMRNGFGTLTVKTADGKAQRQYAGGWKNDKRHVNSIEY